MAVEAGGDGAIVFELVEEALDAASKLVGEWTEDRWVYPVRLRADVGVGTLALDLSAQSIAVVAAICEQHAIFSEQSKHSGGMRSVVRLAFGQLDLDGQPERVDERVDFGRKPAAGASHATTAATFFSPFAAC